MGVIGRALVRDSRDGYGQPEIMAKTEIFLTPGSLAFYS
jgi:hypothetical protein